MKLILHCKKFSREISGQIIEFVDHLAKSEHDIFYKKNSQKKLIDKPQNIILE